MFNCSFFLICLHRTHYHKLTHNGALYELEGKIPVGIFNNCLIDLNDIF